MQQEMNIDVRGVELHLRKSGSGARLLFLHGAGGVRNWGQAFQSLAERYEVIVPDHPGFGRSGDLPGARTAGDVAMFYLDLLEQLAPDGTPVHVVGHSLGGWIAAEAAVRNCSNIASLTLIAPAGLAASGVEAGDVFIWNDDELLSNSYHDSAYIESARAASANVDADIAVRNKVAFAKLAWAPRLHNPGLKHWLHRISAPAQLVWGEQDRILPAGFADEWRKFVAFRRVDILPACGHMPLIERPGAAVQCISQFIDGVRP